MSEKPYPGLRAFTRSEPDIFFGREEQTDELVKRLGRTRFLSVVGTSGCGKSSLARAGLLDALESGLMVKAGARWHVAELRPGDRPMLRLADALLEMAKELGHPRYDDDIAFLQTALERGLRSLIEYLDSLSLPKCDNLVIVVDQFEEIFRFAQADEHDESEKEKIGKQEEADAFVALLLAVAKQRKQPVYVVITMRSDYLGNCAHFAELAEAVNEAQFLTPRLTREQSREAIEGPAGVCRGKVEPALVNRLLNDMGTRPDQLPLMQHVLMRMWTDAEKSASVESPHAGPENSPAQGAARKNGFKVTLTLDDYEAADGLGGALSKHANEAFAELENRQPHIAEVLFRSLVDGTGKSATRRPVSLHEVANVAGATTEAVIDVVECFRRTDRSFLTPEVGVSLEKDSVIDISHESLIRQWDRLSKWAEDESESAKQYRRMLETARLWQKGEANAWTSTELHNAQKWRDEEQPNDAWAKRYGGDRDLALRFLDASLEAEENEKKRKRLEEEQRLTAEFEEKERQRREKEERRRRRIISTALALITVISVSAALVIDMFRSNARFDQSVAEAATERALEAETQARDAATQARDAETMATRSAYNAQLARVHDVLRYDPAEAKQLLIDLEQWAGDLKDFTWHFYLQRSRREPLWEEDCGAAVNSVAFSDEGKYLATAGDDQIVSIWDFAADPIKKFSGHTAPIRAVAFNPTSTTLASADESGMIKLWDFKLGRELNTSPLIGHTGPVTSLSFSPDGSYLASGGHDRKIRLWKVASGREIGVLTGHGDWVTSVAFSSGQHPLLASGSIDRTIRIWDPQNPDDELALLPEQPHSVLCVAFSPDGNVLASGTRDARGTIRLWNVTDLREGKSGIDIVSWDATVSNVAAVREGKRPTLTAALFSESGGVYSLDFSYDGKTLASAGAAGEIKLWDLSKLGEGDTPTNRSTLRERVGIVYSVAFSPTQMKLASAGSDGKVRLWDAAAGQETITLTGHDDSIHSLLFGPENKSLLSVSKDGTARLWTTETGSEVRVLPDPLGPIISLACSQDRNTVALAHEDSTVSIWDTDKLLAEDESTPRFTIKTGTSPTTAIAVSPDGQMLATAHDDDDFSVNVWDVDQVLSGANRQPLVTFTKHRGNVTSLAFALFDGKVILASASEDSTVRLWDVASRKQLKVLTEHDDWVLNVAFIPHNTADKTEWIMATAGDGDNDKTIKLWNVENLVHEGATSSFATLTGHSGGVTALVLSPDGRTLASTSMDKTIRLWDPITGQWRGTLTGHAEGIRALTFSSDSGTLASAGDDRTIKLWIATNVEESGE